MIGGATMGLVGIALLVYSVVQLVRAYRSRWWPVVEAEIVETYVKYRSGRRARYEPIIRYRYTRNGRGYEGDRLLFCALSLTSSSEEEAERFLGRLTAGATIPVRVSPTKPSLSVIEAGVDVARSWPAFAFALVLIVLAVSSVR
jgi:hypothetical protein